MEKTTKGKLKKIASFGMFIMLMFVLNTSFFSFILFSLFKSTDTFSDQAYLGGQSFYFHREVRNGDFKEDKTFQTSENEITSNGVLFDIASKKVKNGLIEYSAHRDDMEGNFLHGLRTTLGLENSNSSNSSSQNDHRQSISKYLVSGSERLTFWPVMHAHLCAFLSFPIFISASSSIECPPPEMNFLFTV